MMYSYRSAPNSRFQTHVVASPNEILGHHEISHPIDSTRDLLTDFQSKPHRRLARAVVPDQQHGVLAADRQLEVLEATEWT